MKLATVRVTNYRSIRDTGTFTISDITCLVGKNEAGKTTILQALEKLNPLLPDKGTFDVDVDYPRSEVEDYRFDVEKGTRKPAIVVEATFTLEDQDLLEATSQFGENVLNEKVVSISKGYDHTLYFKIDVNEKAVLDKLIGNAALPPDTRSEASKTTSLIELSKTLEKFIEEPAVKDFQQKINEYASNGINEYIFHNFLEKLIPKFFYFDEYYQMEGVVNIQALKTRIQQNKLKDSDHPILGLIKLARLNLDQLISPRSTETLISKLQGASNYLNQRVLKYWTQNKHIEIEFDVRPGNPGDPEELRAGVNLWGFVKNTRHKVSTPLGRRSRGFLWFFSFMAWFSTQEWPQSEVILLLDEPALFLHAKAQEDMLRFMEQELKPGHQVIYSTHSPFMVDPTRFDRVRIVEDKSTETDEILTPEKEGTKVITDVLETSPDSVFPIQGALGYEIYQTLFIGPNNLVVEGVSDLLYIQTMSGLLQRCGRTGLDHRWTLTPVGGSDHVPTFVALIGAQKGLKVATLIDISKENSQKIVGLYKKKLLKKNHVFTFGDFLNRENADIEDMFGDSFYLDLVNDEFHKELVKPIDEKDLINQSPRILVRLEEFIKTHPLQNGSSFSHYRPARYFAERVTELQGKILPETLDRFEEAFKALNTLL